MIDLTSTLSPPTALTTLPQTSVEATTLSFPEPPDCAPPSEPDVPPEHAARAKTDRAEAAASTALVRRELIEGLLKTLMETVVRFTLPHPDDFLAIRSRFGVCISAHADRDIDHAGCLFMNSI